MTSQIVLINQSGVALASDTMTTYVRGQGNVKTFPTANKIYELSGDHNVVVLHSGISALGGLSYELLVREWSLQLSGPLPALEDYPRVFDDWLANYRRLQIDEVDAVYNLICDAFVGVVPKIPKSSLKEILASKISDKASNELAEYLRSFADQFFKDDHPYGDLTDESLLNFIRSQKSSVVEHFIEHLALQIDVEKISWQPSSMLSDAIEYFVLQRMKHWCPAPGGATLVFAGFGADEPIGGVIEIRVDSFYMGRLRFRSKPRGPAPGKSDVWIATFAQDEALADFITGLSASRREQLINSAVEILRDIAKESLSNDKLSKFSEDFEARMGDEAWKDYTLPFRQTVKALSLSNLVQLCESLIRIQTLRSITAADEATVGGRIESLCISRDKGVHWHLRYDETRTFDPNPIHPLV